MADTGYVAEVFRSIQGEGVYVGALQVFVRMAGCSLSCSYCDTAYARQPTPHCTVRNQGRTTKTANPINADALLQAVRSFLDGSCRIHSLSLTGGEPLEQPGFIIRFLKSLSRLDVAVCLETNGLHEAAARETVDLVDIVSLDIKLPSLCGGEDFFPIYKRVLPLFARKELFCKVVLARGFDEAEYRKAVKLVSDFDTGVPFVIQPATCPDGRLSLAGEQLASYCREASRRLSHVRVIPQIHRLLGLP